MVKLYVVVLHSQCNDGFVKIKSSHSDYEKAVIAMTKLERSNKIVGAEYNVQLLTGDIL